METLLSSRTEVTESALAAIAHMPTASLPVLMDEAFAQRLTDADVMRIAVLLAQKSYDEGGCPIGAVIIDNATRWILGKGHNTLVQENHPYNHGETSAIRDAGRLDFSRSTLFTSLSPCDICATRGASPAWWWAMSPMPRAPNPCCATRASRWISWKTRAASSAMPASVPKGPSWIGKTGKA